mmetsp:Transcript_36421/g.92849  ORF Transcript_36421/g.92849 Transcript_36421/m.92849 type:complete len:325 (-) Transcript_36421:810-1784(-)
MSLCKPRGSNDCLTASTAVRCPSARRKIAATKVPIARQGELPSESDSRSRGAEARACSMRCSVQKPFSVMSPGHKRVRAALCCNSSPKVMLPLSRCAKSGQTCVTATSKLSRFPATVGNLKAASKRNRRTLALTSKSGKSMDSCMRPPMRPLLPTATLHCHPEPSSPPHARTATWAPKSAPRSLSSCRRARTAASRPGQPGGAGIGCGSVAASTSNASGRARRRTAWATATDAPRALQISWITSRPRTKSRMALGTLPSKCPKLARSALKASWCLRNSSPPGGFASRSAQMLLRIDASMKLLKDVESGSLLASGSMPKSSSART